MKTWPDAPVCTADARYRMVSERLTRTQTPPVTVIVTLYNYRDYIISCLESVKAQTIPSLDLVVVDDCSKDDSVQLTKRWLEANGSRFAGYRLIHHQSNRGLAQARNTAFEQARTEYVFVLDADNLLYPRCLEVLVAALEQCDASFAYCYLEKFGEELGLLSTQLQWNPSRFQEGNRIDAMVLFRRRAWEEVGGYSPAPVTGWEDFEMWFKIVRKGGWGILVPEILARYRVHKKSMLRTVTNSRVEELWAYIQEKYPEFFTGGEAPDVTLLMQRLTTVYSSRSYKITAPLRFAAQRLRSLGARLRGR